MTTLQTLRTLIADDTSIMLNVEVHKPVSDGGFWTESFGSTGGTFISIGKAVACDASGIAHSALRRHGYGSISFSASVYLIIAIPNDPSRVAGLRDSENRRAFSWNQWNNLTEKSLQEFLIWLTNAERRAAEHNNRRAEYYRSLPVNIAAMAQINQQKQNLEQFPTENVDNYLIEKMGFTEEQFKNWGSRTRRERRKEARKLMAAEQKALT
jgi:hypothetical protein